MRTATLSSSPTRPAGLWVAQRPGQSCQGLCEALAHTVAAHGLTAWTVIQPAEHPGRGPGAQVRIDERHVDALAPGHNTLNLRQSPLFYPEAGGDPLQTETLLALLLGHEQLEFPSADELNAALRIRANMARAAARTQLTFETSQAERPADCWTYHEDTGFTILPGRSLIEALRKTTQPDRSGTVYSFSCYRATEYVMLLGMAEELAHSNPALLAALQSFWQRRAIMSGQFHEVFLREHGSLEQPVPPLYYVPGDRVWFRNPDEASSDASGYEGSWTLYLGQGLFANFWQRDRPFTLADKCIEVYHWRDGLYQDAAGDPRIDERRVAQAVSHTQADPERRARVLARMQRLRDPKGVYAEGGCIDATRETARWVCPPTCDLVLPAC